MPAMSPPPPTGTKIAETRPAVTQDLGRNRALTGNDQRIVERMNERRSGFRGKLVGTQLRVARSVAREHDHGVHARGPPAL